MNGAALPRQVQRALPYSAQWASRDLVDDIIHQRVRAEDDPRWTSSGAQSPEEYAFWSWNACGMACLRMCLAARGQDVSLVELCRRCASYGGYVVNGNSVDGLIYAPFVRFVEADFGMAARVVAPMGIQDVLQALAHGEVVIASVHPSIRYGGDPPGRGGHLVLVTGYDLDSGTLSFHNPSGHTPSTQENATLAFDAFERFFAHRGVSVTL